MDEQKHLVTLVDATDDVIIGKDAAGVIQSWNRAAERVLGYTEAELVGVDPSHLAAGVVRRRASCPDRGPGSGRSALRNGAPSQDGHRADVGDDPPITTPKGEIVGTATIAQDTTAPGARTRCPPPGRDNDLSDDAIVSKDLTASLSHGMRLQKPCSATGGGDDREIDPPYYPGRSSAGGGRGPPADLCRAEGRAL